MRLVNFQTVGLHRGAPRVWVEGRRLASLGFTPGMPVEVTASGNLVRIRAGAGSHSVSSRRIAGGVRPIVDINSRELLATLAGMREVKVTGSCGVLDVTPSARAYAIARSLGRTGPLRVLDVFAGGGTLSDGLAGNGAFQVVGGVELEPTFADEFALKHPAADIVTGDFRFMRPGELPDFDVLIAGIPCSEHSNQGRAKKGLAGRPELGELGDLFVPVLSLVAARMPVAAVFENVPNFGSSLAGATMVANLRRLGYSVCETIVDANGEWGEPTGRDRWVCVATLREGFEVRAPGVQFAGTIADYLDPVNPELDRADAERIAVTVEGLRAHNARHAAAGNGFALQVLDGSERKAPVICKSYHKINSSGFMVKTPWGPRMLRKGEICRLQGQTINCESYSHAVQMCGQGVCTRIFTQIFEQLGEFLAG